MFIARICQLSTVRSVKEHRLFSRCVTVVLESICIYCRLETLDVLFAAFSRDTPRKRAGAASVPSATNRCSTAASGSSADPQLEEVVDENFPVSGWKMFGKAALSLCMSERRCCVV